jgi:hypothetical protein
VTNSSGGIGYSAYAATYPVYWNFISNGGFSFPSNPTLFGGSRAFFSDRVTPLAAEYNYHDGSTNIMYMFGMEGLTPRQFFPAAFWENRAQELRPMAIYDIQSADPKDYAAYKCAGIGRVKATELDNGLGAGLMNIPMPSEISGKQTRKFPYLCGETHSLFKITEGDDSSFGNQLPRAFNIVFNVYSRIFLTDRGRKLGDELCKGLSLIPAGFVGLNTTATSICRFPGDPCN